MQKEIKVFSGFNGMNCIGLALQELGIKFKIYASEIDKHATKVSDALFPNTVNLGDITQIKLEDLPVFDLVVGGSPCQGFSFAGKQLNFEDPRSKLFFNFVNILNYCKSKNPNLIWLLENVRMKKRYEAVISRYMNIDPIKINSSLLSAQNRVRLYWTNIGTVKTNLFGLEEPGIKQPKDKKIFLKDVLELNVDEKYYLKLDKKLNIKTKQDKASCFTAGGNSGGNHSDMDLIAIIQKGHGFNKGGIHEEKSPTITTSSWENNNHVIQLNPLKESGGNQPYQHNRVYHIEGKSPALSCDNRKNILEDLKIRKKSKTIRTSGRNSNNRHEWDKISNFSIRRLSPRECARLQTIPEWAIDIILNCGVSNSQIYKMLGNGWTIEVIKYILSHHFK